MATINTIEDLLRLLDENPEWLEALRARLLTRELLELPQTVANLSAEVAALSGKVADLSTQMAALSAEVAALSAEVKAFIAATNARLDKLESDVGVLKEDVSVLKERHVLKEDVKVLKEDVKVLDRRTESMQGDLGIVKAGHARSAAERNAVAIVRDMGLRFTAVLTQADLYDLADRADTSDIPKNTMQSFREADLVIEARDAQGETCYVAVEISFTVNGRDTERAIRNAELLTRFTGKAARAAVAGERMDDRVRERLDSGGVFWFGLTPHALGVG